MRIVTGHKIYILSSSALKHFANTTVVIRRRYMAH